MWNLLRRADDHYVYLSKWTGKTFNIQTFDQSWILDALKSASAGLRLSEILTHQKGQDAIYVGFKGQKLTQKEVQFKTSRLSEAHDKMTCINTPPQLLLDSIGISDLPIEHKRFCYGNLTVPNLNYGLPEELGGRGWPDGPPGNFSSDFERMLQEDCPQCPPWPEHRPAIPQQEFEEILSKPEIDRATAQRFIDPNIAPEVLCPSRSSSFHRTDLHVTRCLASLLFGFPPASWA